MCLKQRTEEAARSSCINSLKIYLFYRWWGLIELFCGLVVFFVFLIKRLLTHFWGNELRGNPSKEEEEQQQKKWLQGTKWSEKTSVGNSYIGAQYNPLGFTDPLHHGEEAAIPRKARIGRLRVSKCAIRSCSVIINHCGWVALESLINEVMTIHHTPQLFPNNGKLACFLTIQRQNKQCITSYSYTTDPLCFPNNREWCAQRPLMRKTGVHWEGTSIFLALWRKQEYLVLLLLPNFQSTCLSNLNIVLLEGEMSAILNKPINHVYD